MMLNPTLELLCLCPPIIIATLHVTRIVTKHLDVTIVATFQFLLELFNSRRVLAKKFSAAKEVTALSIILLTFNAVKNKEEKHLILKETSVMIMKQMPSPFFWTMLASLDVV